MKVLFLDIDGVLNSRRSCVAFGGYPWDVRPCDMKMFDRVAIALIKKLCKETEAKIVLSSSWRIGRDPLEIGKGLKLPIFAKTPSLNSGHRGSEISEWLLANSVSRYAIVDDESDMLEEQNPFFVKTTMIDGLQFEHYEKLKEILA